jgi:cobalamin biosynthesis Mg chelatase CobN
MTESSGSTGTSGTPTGGTSANGRVDNRSVEEIERDLERTREQLGATVEALGAKLDVKSRTKDWAEDKKTATQQTARQATDQHGRELAFGVGALVAVVVVVAVWRSRR